MFKLLAFRSGSKFEQSFQSWDEANEKSKWLASQGFTVDISRACVPKEG